MFLRQIYEPYLSQYAYLVGCKTTGQALIIDSQRDIDIYCEEAAKEKLEIKAVAETHIHADFISGTREFAERGVKVYVSDEGAPEWRYDWVIKGNYSHQLLHDQDTFKVGNVRIKALLTPGHSPEHLSYLIYDPENPFDEPMAITTGDFVFVGDLGRPDLLESAFGIKGEQKKSAHVLFQSVAKFNELPEYLQVLPGHGAGSACGKTLGSVPVSTVGYEKRYNQAIQNFYNSEASFVDAILADQTEPPLYFSKIKNINRKGQTLLHGEIPMPDIIKPELINDVAGNDHNVIIDIRDDFAEFMSGHLPGSIHNPLCRTYPKIAGSLIDSEQDIYIVCDQTKVDDVVRSLIRIGLDKVRGIILPEFLHDFDNYGIQLSRIEITDFDLIAEGDIPSDSLIFDVRNAFEYKSGHIAGSTHIPYTMLPKKLAEIPKDKTLLVHCEVGRAASSAVSYLKRNGFKVAYVMDEFENWKGDVVH